MNRKYGLITIFVVVSAAFGLWYLQLKDHQKAFLNNLLRQIPDLPGRYFI